MRTDGSETAAAALLDEAIRLVGFRAGDLDALRAAAPVLRPHFAALTDRFYEVLEAHPEAARAIPPGISERLKQTLRVWAEELLVGERDGAYAAKRIAIGRLHLDRWIDHRYVIGAMGLVRSFLAERVRAAGGAGAEEAARAIGRACDLDLILITEAYHHASRMKDIDAGLDVLRGVLDRAPIAVIGYDRAGVVRDWNPGAERLYGLPRAETVGRSLLDLFVLPEDRALVWSLVDRAFAGEVAGAIERRHRARDGRILDVVLAQAPIRSARGIAARDESPDSIEEVFIFCLDVTELLALRTAIAEREKMAALGTLAAGLAHEVGNPLSSISAVCQLVERKGDDGRLGERMRSVREALGRIDGIVRRVLDFARGRHDPEETPEDLPLAAEVARVLDLVRLDARMKGVSAEADVPAGLAVRAPRDGLAQVLLNLLLNAGEAAGSGGRVAVLAADAGSIVEIVVEDSGPGFTDEALRHGLEPFYTTRRGGTGLGLAISYGIARRAGGSLRIENRAEGGARVVADLPAASGFLKS